jgi:hypothetical protein
VNNFETVPPNINHTPFEAFETMVSSVGKFRILRTIQWGSFNGDLLGTIRQCHWQHRLGITVNMAHRANHGAFFWGGRWEGWAALPMIHVFHMSFSGYIW